MTAALAVLGIAVALLAVLVVGLLRSHAEILRRLHELGAGVYDEAPAGERPAPAPRAVAGVARPRPATTSAAPAAHDIAGAGPAGEAVAVGVVGVDHDTLVAFLSSGCGTCGAFWEAFAGGAGVGLGEGTRLVVVTRGAGHESPAEVARLAPGGVTTVMSDAAFDDYRVPASPYFVLVDGPGRRVVGEGAAVTWTQVVDLLRRSAADGTGRGDAGVDGALAAAGIVPGHPSLYPDRDGS